jgi:hypothetical protein
MKHELSKDVHLWLILGFQKNHLVTELSRMHLDQLEDEIIFIFRE